MELIIKKINTNSLEELEAFNSLMGHLDTKADNLGLVKQIIDRYNQREDANLIVVYHQNKVIGTVLGILVDDYCGECKRICYVENAIILPEYQGKGVGRFMFNALYQWCEANNVLYELLVSSNFRVGAHKFYEHIGYKEVKGFKRYHK